MGIATGDNNATVIAYDQTHGIEYPSISGQEGGGTQINNDYQIGAYPTIVLINPAGQIVEQDIWPITSATTLISRIVGWGLTTAPCELSNLTEVISFSIPEQLAPATIGAGVIDVDLVFNTPQDALIPSFTISDGAEAAIAGTAQQSGVSVVDFTSGSVVYTVTAEDGVTTQEWTVNVHNGLSISGVNYAESGFYPNPANNKLFFEGSDVQDVILSDVTGKIVFASTANLKINSIDLSDLPAGVYFIRYHESNEMISSRFSIIR